MSKVKLAISGCMGRMGRQLVKSSKTDKNFKLTTLTENRLIEKKIAGIKPSLNHENSFKNVDLIIDFTIPKCTFEILKIALKLKKRVKDVTNKTNLDEPTIPITLKEEIETNTFLRYDINKIKKTLELDNASKVEVFKKLRILKDQF